MHCRSRVFPFTLWHSRLNSDHQVWWWALYPLSHLTSLRLCPKPQFSFFYFYFIFYSFTILSLYNVLWASVPLLSSYSPPTNPVDCLCLNKSLSLFVCLFSPWKLKLWVLGVGIRYALYHWRFSVRQRRKWQVGSWKTARVSVFILKQSKVERLFCGLGLLALLTGKIDGTPSCQLTAEPLGLIVLSWAFPWHLLRCQSPWNNSLCLMASSSNTKESPAEF